MERIGIRVRGIVQGVGFRPFVYNLARRIGLGGHCYNDSDGLAIEVEGPADLLQSFVNALGTEHPPLAWVQELNVTSLPPNGAGEFTIRRSVAQAGKFSLISAD